MIPDVDRIVVTIDMRYNHLGLATFVRTHSLEVIVEVVGTGTELGVLGVSGILVESFLRGIERIQLVGQG